MLPMTKLTFIQVLSAFAMPIGIYRLLKCTFFLSPRSPYANMSSCSYLSGDRTSNIKPWVWIAWMALGPILGSIAVQWYRFVNVRLHNHRSPENMSEPGYRPDLRSKLKLSSRSWCLTTLFEFASRPRRGGQRILLRRIQYHLRIRTSPLACPAMKMPPTLE